jgi:putative glutamine amidotransferase
MKIGITTSETNFQNYPFWIIGKDEIEVIELSYKTNNLNDLNLCDGLVLSGGVDIMPENIEYENAPNQFNPSRDSFERAVLSKALLLKIPILGICRGLQLINLHFGGTLILDLGPKNLSHKKFETDNIHQIEVDEKSKLFEIVSAKKGEVNSAHHQAINQLANCLNTSAKSTDGVIEAVEIADKNKPFLIAVQWHPERMQNQESAFTKNIREAFLAKINK